MKAQQVFSMPGAPLEIRWSLNSGDDWAVTAMISQSWDGKELKLAFEVDFAKEQLGRAHHMKFSAKAGGKTLAQAAQMKLAQAAPASAQP